MLIGKYIAAKLTLPIKIIMMGMMKIILVTIRTIMIALIMEIRTKIMETIAKRKKIPN